MSWTLLDSERVRNVLDRHFLLRVPTQEKRIAFTFDDGPSPRNTPRLMELLERRGVRATFFLLGMRARQYPSLGSELRAAGHEIGNHTHLHLPLPFLPQRWLHSEIGRALEQIEEACGVRPRYCRPPFGWFSPRVLRALAHHEQLPVIGNVYPRDSRNPGREKIVQRVMDRVHPGSIVILHDGGWHPTVDRSQTIEAVDELIDRLGAEGYGFQTLSQLESAEETA